MFHKSERNKKTTTEITFHPHGPLRFFTAFFAAGLIMIFWLVAWYSNTFSDIVFLIVYCLFFLIWVKYVHPFTRLQVTIGEQGITLYNSKAKISYYADWTQFKAAYLVYGNRTSYLLFTPEPVDRPTRKKLISAMCVLEQGCPKLSVDGCVCFMTSIYEIKILKILEKKFAVIE